MTHRHAADLVATLQMLRTAAVLHATLRCGTQQAPYRLTTYSITPTADGSQKSLLGCAKAAGRKSHPDAMLFFPLKVWASYLLLCIALQQPAARASQWETLHETSSNVWGGRRTPPVR